MQSGAGTLNYPSLILRVGLAFSFLYPPIAAFFSPTAWIGYFPPFLIDIFPNNLVLLHTFGAFEVIIALWLLWGRYILYPATIAAAVLLVIIFFNLSQLDVLFRDISIAAMAVALVVIENRRSLHSHL